MGSLLSFGSGFNIMFTLIFVVVLSGFVFVIVRGISQWSKNNNSPRLTVDARVVSRRTDVTNHWHNNGDTGSVMHSNTWYYVTFQVESGDRMELSVSGRDYGMLAEGDTGRLTFQGTRYLSFDRC